MAAAGRATPEILSWDFDIFETAKRSGGRPLQHVTMALLEEHGLLDGWLLDRPTVEAYLAQVEGHYRANPYHNHVHAADVTQTAGVIMSAVDAHMRSLGSNSSALTNGTSPPRSCGCCDSCCSAPCGGAAGSATQAVVAAGSNHTSPGAAAPSSPPGLSKLERFAVILASAVHDLGHRGVNNAFLVATRDPLAVTYNDRSVNENMHAATAFTLALQPGANIFAAFNQEEYVRVRKLVLDMVLSTDMDVHFDLLKRFADARATQPDVRTWDTPVQRSLLFQMLVHLADLANPSRPWHLALAWAEGVVTEFLAQGAKEADAGIPVSPPCDRERVCMPAAQLFFIERFCGPTLEAFGPAAPLFYDMAAPWLADTTARWNVFKAAGVGAPFSPYPTLPPRSPAEAAALWTTLGGRPRCCSACQQHAGGLAQQGGKQQQQAAAAATAGAPALQPAPPVLQLQAAAQAAG